ncbi:hypothetical protein I4U23_028103 [Adineta vaga]|nr:hypothetical protein I4U23_028103 [Adineta vaga]
MVYIHWSKYQNHRPLFQICSICCDYKRYLLLSLFILCIIMLFYVNSDTFSKTDMIENEDLCSKLLHITINSNRTLCSEEADRRGNKQRIISLSIFGPKENSLFVDEKFSQLISPLIDEAKFLFPTWIIRLYADESTIHRLDLHNLSRTTRNIDVCNVNQLPILGNVGEYLSGKLWRFLPTLDPMVDFVSSRDLDSPLTHREQVVVEQFVNSSYLFLTIRDHPFHNVPILGGLWTSALYRNRVLFLRLFRILLDKIRVQQYSLMKDQTLLEELIWPHVKDQSLVFDSYTCEQFPDGNLHAFPTQRPARDCHLGCIRPCCQNSLRIIFEKPCPRKCRPADHPDWTYC